MTLNERVILHEAKLMLQSVADKESTRGSGLIAKDICKVIHNIEIILDDDLYGRYEKIMEEIDNED